MKSMEHVTIGIDESGNTYKQIRLQDFTSGKTKVRNTYFLNGVKVTKYDRWWVKEWISNNICYCETTTNIKK